MSTSEPLIVQLEITDCSQCPHYGTAADPDPNKWDWFRDGNHYGYCGRTHNDQCQPSDVSAAVRSPFKTLFTRRKMIEVGKLPVPEWCPMRKKD